MKHLITLLIAFALFSCEKQTDPIQEPFSGNVIKPNVEYRQITFQYISDSDTIILVTDRHNTFDENMMQLVFLIDFYNPLEIRTNLVSFHQDNTWQIDDSQGIVIKRPNPNSLQNVTDNDSIFRITHYIEEPFEYWRVQAREYKP